MAHSLNQIAFGQDPFQDMKRGRKPAPRNKERFMPGDTVRVMTMNGPWNGTVTGYRGGKPLVSPVIGATTGGYEIEQDTLKRLDGPAILPPRWGER